MIDLSILYNTIKRNFILQVELYINNILIQNIESVEYEASINTPTKLTVNLSNYSDKLLINLGDRVVLKRGYKGLPLEVRFLGYIQNIEKKSLICYDELYFIFNQKAIMSEYRNPLIIKDSNGDLIANTSIKQVMEQLLLDTTLLDIRNTPLILDFNDLLDWKTTFIRGGVSKGLIIRSILIGKRQYYINDVTNVFTVIEMYKRDLLNYFLMSDKFMIEDNLIEPAKEHIGIRYIYGENSENFGVYPNENVDRIHDIFLTVTTLSEALGEAIKKYEELNFKGFKGSFSMLGLPIIRVGNTFNLSHRNFKLPSDVRVETVTETIDKTKIRQTIILG